MMIAEYTVAVTKGRAYHPVERIFAEGQLVSEANGTATETLLDPTDHQRIQRCQQLALDAYNACQGSAYGRVDLRYVCGVWCGVCVCVCVCVCGHSIMDSFLPEPSLLPIMLTPLTPAPPTP